MLANYYDDDYVTIEGVEGRVVMKKIVKSVSSTLFMSKTARLMIHIPNEKVFGVQL